MELEINNIMDNLEFVFNIKKEKACIKIQKVWRNSISNPEYLICKNRILDEFNLFKK